MRHNYCEPVALLFIKRLLFFFGVNLYASVDLATHQVQVDVLSLIGGEPLLPCVHPLPRL